MLRVESITESIYFVVLAIVRQIQVTDANTNQDAE